jgi:hypothetical protein
VSVCRWVEIQLREAGSLACDFDTFAGRIAVCNSGLRDSLLRGRHARESGTTSFTLSRSAEQCAQQIQ